jgi:hypothetical protein
MRGDHNSSVGRFFVVIPWPRAPDKNDERRGSLRRFVRLSLPFSRSTERRHLAAVTGKSHLWGTKMTKTLAISIAFILSACGSTAQSTRSSSNEDRGETCQHLIDIAQICYDNSNPDTSCGDMYQGLKAALENIDLPPSQQNAFATFCGNMCRARKRGIAWSDVRGSMRNNCI